MKQFLINFLFGMVVLPSFSQVFVCSTIHQGHKENLNYTYEDLFQFINSYDPEIIAVEVRPIDIDSSEAYLSQNYPWEMYEVKNRFKTKEIIGFDWLGQELEGKAIPQNYWKEKSELKKLERKLSKDSIFLSTLHRVDSLQQAKLGLFLNEDLIGLNDGRYDAVNLEYYSELEKTFEGSPYQDLTDFYRQRNERIAFNLLQIIRKNQGKKILVLTGADHRSYIHKIFREHKVPFREQTPKL